MRKKYIISIFLFILCVNIRLDGFNSSFRNTLYRSEEDLSISLYNDNFKSAEWYSSWGGSEEEYCADTVIDSSGNIYLVGNTRSFGAGGNDMFLLKINSTGEILWNRSWGGIGYDECGAIALDSSENIYLAGTTDSYGAGSTDMCLVKYSNDGDYLWNKTWGGVSSEYCRDIEIDQSGDIYLAGQTGSFGAGGNDMCLVKYSYDGNYIWNKTFGGTTSESCNDLGIDLYGNFYLAGTIYPLGEPGADIHLIKLNRDADYEWDRAWGDNYSDTCESISIDAVNNVYLCGRISKDDMSSSFVMKYSTLNLVQWNYTWNVLDESFCTDITLDSTEYIYTTGVGIDFYTEEINSFIYKFGYLGEVLWKCIIKGENREMAMCIELDTMDNIYIGGIIPNIDGYNDDVFLMKNPKPTTKDAIAGYNIFLIYILISSIVMTVVVKECFRKKKTHHFRKFISYL